jgi:hypothetical protein
MVDVREIITQRLRAMGANGLYHEDCGCGIDDLAPCGMDCLDCEPAVYSPKHEMWIPILAEPACWWSAYQRDQTVETCCRWLKHRAYMRLEGGCRK